MGKWRAMQDKDANCLFTIALRWDDCRLRRNDQFHEAAPRRHTLAEGYSNSLLPPTVSSPLRTKRSKHDH